MRIEGENSKFGQGFNHFMCITAYRCAARAKIIQWGELYFEIVFLCLRFFLCFNRCFFNNDEKL